MAADKDRRHLDMVVLSLMALATAAMGGLAIFLRSATQGELSTWTVSFILLSIVAYAFTILTGMHLLGRKTLEGKEGLARGVRYLVLFQLAAIAATLFVIMAGHFPYELVPKK